MCERTCLCTVEAHQTELGWIKPVHRRVRMQATRRIQAAARGFLMRQRCATEKSLATKIEAAWRGYTVRTSLHAFKWLVSLIDAEKIYLSDDWMAEDAGLLANALLSCRTETITYCVLLRSRCTEVEWLLRLSDERERYILVGREMRLAAARLAAANYGIREMHYGMEFARLKHTYESYMRA